MRKVAAAFVVALFLLAGGLPAQAAPAAPIRATAFTVAATAPENQPLNGACVPIHNESQCGNARVTLTLKGFQAYGGIPACQSGDSTCFMTDRFGRLGGGSARLAQLYRCGATGPLRFMSTSIPALSIYFGVPSGVNGSTRVDADTARVQAIYPFPNPHEYSPCPSDTRVVAAVVYHFSFIYTGGNGPAARTFLNNGYFVVAPAV